MSRSKGFWKGIEANHSRRNGPPRATADICDSLACREQREESGRPSGWLLRWTRTGKRDGRTASPPPVLPGSDVQRALDRDHGGAAGVDGVDDLGVVNALEVDRGDAEVGVAELALDDDQRHALAGHFDGVGVAELVRREASPHASLAGDAAQLGAGGGGRPGPPARGAVDDAEQRTDRQFDPRLEPGRELLPGPVVHPDLA